MFVSQSECLCNSFCYNIIPDPLEKPNISMKPDFRVFVRGESAEISCSGNYPGSNFSLYRDGNIIASRIAPENNNKTTFTSLKSTAGNYWCKYTKHMDGRELTSPEKLTSPESERVGVTLRGKIECVDSITNGHSLPPDMSQVLTLKTIDISPTHFHRPTQYIPHSIISSLPFMTYIPIFPTLSPLAHTPTVSPSLPYTTAHSSTLLTPSICQSLDFHQ
uniref:Ig-like domain-containing protein n=1 Tax=Callorhinchus milii TaxID=7868 RepID=A0A4W3GBG4_CALMI